MATALHGHCITKGYHARQRHCDGASISDRFESGQLLSQSRWDIFCSVVDNYGDVGVAWRLARQLAAEHGLAVRLLVDDLRALSRITSGIAPGIELGQDKNVIQGVELRRWASAHDVAVTDDGKDAVAEVVIEAFGCGLPARYADAMVRRARSPAWIVLEYLSAESWVETHHGLPSPHPSLPLVRHFFFPGFTPATGGLLRERGLFARRDAFRSDPDARAEFWRLLGVTEPSPTAIVVSLFCYPQAPLAALLDAWADGDDTLVGVVPEGIAAGALDRWTEGRVPHAGQSLTRGRLVIAGIPFLAQDDYDRLLWACDFNFVRGEDSFVRAQWAARPLVWNAYPQAENAHALKQDAFLARFGDGLAPEPAAALRSFSRAWNDSDDGGPNVGSLWPALVGARSALDEHARAWAQALALQTDLASALVKFVSERV
jgi:uncharacterized repeat protein (TIGR03837 family)